MVVSGESQLGSPEPQLWGKSWSLASSHISYPSLSPGASNPEHTFPPGQADLAGNTSPSLQHWTTPLTCRRVLPPLEHSRLDEVRAPDTSWANQIFFFVNMGLELKEDETSLSMWLEVYDTWELQIRRTICHKKRKERGAEGFQFLVPIPSREAVTFVFCQMSLVLTLHVLCPFAFP